MKTKVVETSITSETVSQDTVSGEVEEAIKDKTLEIAKKAMMVPNKDKEQPDDWGSIKERENEIKQTGKNMNRLREAYFNFL